MNTAKEARRDAREYARAKMYYGEGAGTRRKLITNTVQAKAHRDPAYARAFHSELERQDMAEHAAKARTERRRADRTETVSKNVKGVLTGNSKGMSTTALVVGLGVYYAHQTGLDRRVYYSVKTKVRSYRARRQAKKIVDGWMDEASNNSN